VFVGWIMVSRLPKPETGSFCRLLLVLWKVELTTITSCGGFAPSRLEYLVAVVSLVVRAKLTSPAPVTSDRTFASNQLPADPDPDMLTTLPKDGAVW